MLVEKKLNSGVSLVVLLKSETITEEHGDQEHFFRLSGNCFCFFYTPLVYRFSPLDENKNTFEKHLHWHTCSNRLVQIVLHEFLHLKI